MSWICWDYEVNKKAVKLKLEMEPKEKALELFNHFYENKFDGPGFLGTPEAKREAVFVVDEIIKALGIPYLDGNPENSPKFIGDALFWTEVKKIINDIPGPDYLIK